MILHIATVLYEDQRGVTGDFGPHALVLACVADETGIDRFGLNRAILGLPQKGNAKLLATCREKAADFSADGSALFAVFDLDRLSELLTMPADSCKRDLIASIRHGITLPLGVVLLERNIEELLDVAGRCSGAGAALLQKALRKDRLLRDRIFNRLAAHPDRSSRDSLLSGFPSLRRLVRQVVEIVQRRLGTSA